MNRLLCALFCIVAIAATGQVVAPRSFTNTAVIRVDVNGSDTTGMRGRMDRPFASITNAWTNLQSGDTLRIGPGTFYVTPLRSTGSAGTGQLLSSNLQNVVIEGDGWNTKISHDGAGDVMNLRDSTNWTIRNLWFDSNATWETNNELYASIRFSSNNVGHVIENVKITDTGGHGISQPHGDKTSWDITVRGCWFENIGTWEVPGTGRPDGTAISGIGNNWKVIGCRFKNNKRDVELEHSAKPLSTSINFLAEGNLHTDAWQFNYWLTGAAGYGVNMQNLVIRGNTISNTFSGPLYTGHVVPTAITANCGYGLTIADNIISGVSDTNTAKSAIAISATSGSGILKNVNISGNTIVDVDGKAMYLYGNEGVWYSLSNVVIRGNIIESCNAGSGYGAIDFTAQNAVIDGNIISRLSSDYIGAISVRTNASDVVIANNIFDAAGAGTMDYGVRLWQNVSNIYIGHNIWKQRTLTNVLDLGAVNLVYTAPIYGTNVPSTSTNWTVVVPNGTRYIQTDGGTNWVMEGGSWVTK